ncbi:MAG: RNA polymerase sigma factor [Desulfobacteraceae bacterium]|nr:RNA polymerase sigma factor [Desulfobacteraceae bacterium]MBC2756429.1 RNA polymerase sigma factor [Desulfobacteraceae bacterium]MBC2763559.1 RNA polymerase sigma factor [ANME-2 cluster archaeon]
MPSSTHKINDSDIIHRIIGGNVNAFEIILDKYKKYVFTIVKRHVPEAYIEDTVQDVFIRVYKALPGFDNRSSFKHWMTSITIRTCYDLLRKKYRSKEITISSLAGNDQEAFEKKLSEQAKADYYGNHAQKETKEMLAWALARLTPENKMLIELIYLEGYTIKEAAELLGWSVANVKVRTFRCRKQLNTILTNLIEA